MANERPLSMKTIGILGGMSNQATAEYYRLINEMVNERLGGWEIAETIIIGANFGNIQYYVRNEMWEEAAAYLVEKARSAERAGADLLVCVSNTMHRVADTIREEIKIPFIHIADPTADAIRGVGLKKVGLLGTKSVMSASYMRQYYEERHGLRILVPDPDDQERIDRIIFDELVRRDIRSVSKAAYLEVCGRLKQQGAQGVILGCTEIFLLIEQEDMPDFPMFNTTSLHVEAAVREALNA